MYQLKNEQIEYKNDVRTLNMGTSNENTRSQQLLLERDEPNVVNRVGQEVIKIIASTSLALSYLKLLNKNS